MRQQERESFASFFPKFERELANAGGSNFDESIKVMFLRTVLNFRFSACLPITRNYITYQDLVADLQTAAAGIANQEVFYGRRSNPQPYARLPEPSYSQNDMTPMDWSLTKNNQGRIHEETNQRPRAR